jgi:hypothetical protein
LIKVDGNRVAVRRSNLLPLPKLLSALDVDSDLLRASVRRKKRRGKVDEHGVEYSS